MPSSEALVRSLQGRVRDLEEQNTVLQKTQDVLKKENEALRRQLAELGVQVDDSPAAAAGGAKEEVAQGDQADGVYVVSVPKSEKVKTVDGEVVLYRVEATLGKKYSEGMARFQMFSQLHDDVVKYYDASYSHLKGNLPALPKKQWKLLVDHLDDGFIEERRVALEQYLQALAKMPHISGCKAFEDFLAFEQ